MRLLFLILLLPKVVFCGFEVLPQNLLHPQRLDLMAKYIYAKHHEMGVSDVFAYDLYLNHLLAMNDRFYEAKPLKTSASDYLNSFKYLLNGISDKGFEKKKSKDCNIWVKFTKKNPGSLYFCDGAHRIASCLLHNKMVYVDKVVQVDDLPLYNYQFLKRKKLAEKYLDAMALEYSKISEKCFLAFVFPRFKGTFNEVRQMLGGSEKIVYEKEIVFSQIKGQMNLLDQLYSGWNSYTPGAMHDWEGYFPKDCDGRVRVFLFENDSLDSVRGIKEKIRQIGGSHFSIHTTDDAAETLEVAKLVFVKNSIHFINNRKFGLQKKLEKFLAIYKKCLDDLGVDQDNFCVDGSGALAAYGLRDCNDLDFIHKGYDSFIDDFKKLGIDSNNHLMNLHNKTLNQIIFDPDNYFYYKGVKFGSLNILKERKLNRNSQPGDGRDIELIDSLSSI